MFARQQVAGHTSRTRVAPLGALVAASMLLLFGPLSPTAQASDALTATWGGTGT